MSYQPSNAVRIVQQLVAQLEEKTQEYQRLDAVRNSARLATERAMETAKKEDSVQVARISAAHDAAIAKVQKECRDALAVLDEARDARLRAFAEEYARKDAERERALESLKQTKTQLQRELEKMGLPMQEPAAAV